MALNAESLPPPPPYEAVVPSSVRTDAPLSNDTEKRTQSLSHEEAPGIPCYSQSLSVGLSQDARGDASANASTLQLPIVLPQTSKSFRGAFFSPFVRAYASELEGHGISQEMFLSCIDGLNEVFIAHPVFQVTGGVGGAMAMFGGALPPVQWAGMGLQFGSGVASAATSYGRTKVYVKNINQTLFHPAGLQMNIVTTKKMMEKVGYGRETLTLPPLESGGDLNEVSLADDLEDGASLEQIHSDDPRMRRIRALEGYVTPVDFNVPPVESPSNVLRRMGNAEAKRQSRKQEKKMMEEREKGLEKQEKKQKHVDKARREGEQKIAKVERSMAKLQAKFEAKSASPKVMNDPIERQKLKHDHEKEKAKLERERDKETAEMKKEVRKQIKDANKDLDKAEKKEHSIAKKIRWIVISTWDGGENSEGEVDEE